MLVKFGQETVSSPTSLKLCEGFAWFPGFVRHKISETNNEWFNDIELGSQFETIYSKSDDI